MLRINCNTCILYSLSSLWRLKYLNIIRMENLLLYDKYYILTTNSIYFLSWRQLIFSEKYWKFTCSVKFVKQTLSLRSPKTNIYTYRPTLLIHVTCFGRHQSSSDSTHTNIFKIINNIKIQYIFITTCWFSQVCS